VKERKDYGPLIDSGRKDWRGDPIFYQRVTVRDSGGNVIRQGERQVLANGEAPRTSIRYDKRGIV
jgi:hypothetical protein